jgi:hypothetical protein
LEKQNNFNGNKSVVGKTVMSLNSTRHTSSTVPFYRSFSSDKGCLPEVPGGEVALKFKWERFTKAHKALPPPRCTENGEDGTQSRWVEINVWEAELFAEQHTGQAVVAIASLGRKLCTTKSSFHQPGAKAKSDEDSSTSVTLHEWGEIFRFRFPPLVSADTDSTSQYMFVALYHKSKLGRETFIGQVCVFLEHDLENGEQITGWFPLLDKYGQRGEGMMDHAPLEQPPGDDHSGSEPKVEPFVSSIGRIYLCISMEDD